MKTFENRVFNRTPTYQSKLIKRLVAIIRFGNRKERTIRGYKMYIFKMMEGVVRKNINNYYNLILGLPRSPSEATRDELITECYIILDTCITKFKPSKTNNFYFYFNKALSRNFYKLFQRYSKHTYIEATDEMLLVNRNMRSNENLYTIESICHSLNLTLLQRRIIQSRIEQQPMNEFLKKNKDVRPVDYSNAMLKIKEIMMKHIHEFKSIESDE